MFKKALLPILGVLALVALLAAAAYWYTQKETDNWPFENHHHH